MSAFTNSLLIFVPTIGAGIASFVGTKGMGDMLPDDLRTHHRLFFAAMAGTTIFFFVFYFLLVIGVPVDLRFMYPFTKSYPWWITPLSLAAAAYVYMDLAYATTTLNDNKDGDEGEGEEIE
jgi:hypothetical protein